MMQNILVELHKRDREDFIHLMECFGIEVEDDSKPIADMQEGDMFYSVVKNDVVGSVTSVHPKKPYYLGRYLIVSNDKKTGVITAVGAGDSRLDDLDKSERLGKLNEFMEEYLAPPTVLTLSVTPEKRVIIVGASREFGNSSKYISVLSKECGGFKEVLENINTVITRSRYMFKFDK